MPKNYRYVKSQKLEAALGVLFFILGGLLIYDAFDARGKKLPWPIGGILPW